MNVYCNVTYDSNRHLHPRHILAAVHFNFNLHREVKRREKDGVERVKVSYPKFKNGEASVRDVRVEPNFGKHLDLQM